MAKPYPPLRALVLRELDKGQRTAPQLRDELMPSAENCMTISRLLQTMAQDGTVRCLKISRATPRDTAHAYALALPLKEALARDKDRHGDRVTRRAVARAAAEPAKGTTLPPARWWFPLIDPKGV